MPAAATIEIADGATAAGGKAETDGALPEAALETGGAGCTACAAELELAAAVLLSPTLRRLAPEGSVAIY